MAPSISSGKGQVFEPDFLASLALFTLVIGLFLAPWNTVMSSQTRFDAVKEMREDAVRTTTFLVSTPGYPANWDAENVRIPGFATDDNVLSAEKISAFGSLSYQEKRRLLRVRNFYLVFLHSGNPIQIDGEPAVYGRSYSNASTIVPVEREVLVNVSGTLKPATMRYVVWRE
ncbi:MAG: hypothetical protein ABEJ75_01785 [Candidatus Nanohaloarchaea archaeon]